MGKIAFRDVNPLESADEVNRFILDVAGQIRESGKLERGKRLQGYDETVSWLQEQIKNYTAGMLHVTTLFAKWRDQNRDNEQCKKVEENYQKTFAALAQERAQLIIMFLDEELERQGLLSQSDERLAQLVAKLPDEIKTHPWNVCGLLDLLRRFSTGEINFDNLQTKLLKVWDKWDGIGVQVDLSTDDEPMTKEGYNKLGRVISAISTLLCKVVYPIIEPHSASLGLASVAASSDVAIAESLKKDEFAASSSGSAVEKQAESGPNFRKFIADLRAKKTPTLDGLDLIAKGQQTGDSISFDNRKLYRAASAFNLAVDDLNEKDISLVSVIRDAKLRKEAQALLVAALVLRKGDPCESWLDSVYASLARDEHFVEKDRVMLFIS